MSTGTHQWFNHWERVAAMLQRCHFSWNASTISPKDERTWRDALILQGILTEDLTLCDPSSASAEKWCKTASQLDIAEVMGALKALDGLVCSHVGSPYYFTLADCKRQLNPICGKWRKIVKPIYPLLLRFEATGTTRDFRVLHQWLTFLSHISLDSINCDKDIDKFVDTDKSTEVLDWSIPTAMNTIARQWLSGFSITRRPCHGNGATYEGSSKQVLLKWKSISTDSMLQYVFAHQGLDIEDYVPFDKDGLIRTSKLKLVPKTVLKKRTICMEPASLQYFQQMVFRSLIDHFEHSPAIRSHITLRDPGHNRELCKQGSYFGSYSTIDLSAASDTVLWSLVKRVFANTPLLPWLYATRSRNVELPNGECVALRKFATMGSALCFPIECLVFSLVCEYTVSSSPDTRGRSRYHVYGDDIVIETRFVDALVHNLTALGFQVNRDKSFTDESVNTYRESCGAEYRGGDYVTPWKLSRWFHGTYVTCHEPEGIPRMVDAINMARRYGYMGVRRWLHAAVYKLPQYARPTYTLSDDDSVTQALLSTYRPTIGIHTYFPNSFVRYNRDYQRPEIRNVGVAVGKVTPHDDPEYESIRLFDWYNSCSEAGKLREPRVLTDLGSKRVKTSWSPL